MPSTLTDLPAELLYQIYFLAQNPFLPRTNRYLYSTFHCPSAYYAATYLLGLYSTYGPNEILVRSLRHPICDVQVAKEMQRLWDQRRGYKEPSYTKSTPTKKPRSSSIAERENQHRSRSRSRSNSPTPQTQLLESPLTCSELPRRLFRDSLNPSRPIHPLIKYLFEIYSPSPNSHKGYPLFRAILTSNYELVSYLLSKGADPSIKDSFALDIAISMKDLKMVKLLVERDIIIDQIPKSPSPTKDESKKGKKIKLGDRLEIGTKMVEKAIEKGAKEIINYFVYEKKVMPPLHSIMKIGKSEFTNVKSVKTQKRKKPPRSSLSMKA
ncbi:uncharacterized protein I206_104955 [Kwoniella pini CBS 10737]|uniref:Uncharacterized protein n=1 Tax=Kwoniella pini CBS 10737 TaxID=1296096 RepID=A0A1B9I895_9TREE|nr:uncharacterized protein I206_02494 [Kwoniella pini CBS 10737]OCF51778.1 hypothetical protein I206_02494 [Kwoniella pini CBS 10737]